MELFERSSCDCGVAAPVVHSATRLPKRALTSRGCVGPDSTTIREHVGSHPDRRVDRGSGAAGTRMEKVHDVSRHHSIHMEIVLFQSKFRVTTVEVTYSVVLDALTENEILSASRSADGVVLDEAQFFDRLAQRSLRRQRTVDRHRAEPANVNTRGASRSLPFHNSPARFAEKVTLWPSERIPLHLTRRDLLRLRAWRGSGRSVSWRIKPACR